MEHPVHGAVHPVGGACSSTGRRPSGTTELVEPSVACAIAKLVKPINFVASLPYVVFGHEVSPEAIVASVVAGSVRNAAPPAAVPVSGACWECKCLRFNQPGVPLCASGSDCVAAGLDRAPGPLPMYLSPEEALHRKYPVDGYCLLCIRADATAIDMTTRRLVESSTMQIGAAALCIAPFQNLVDQPDGYKSSAIGVRPSSFTFTPVHIVSGDAPVSVNYDEAVGGFYVDQSNLVWSPKNDCGTRPTTLSAPSSSATTGAALAAPFPGRT